MVDPTDQTESETPDYSPTPTTKVASGDSDKEQSGNDVSDDAAKDWHKPAATLIAAIGLILAIVGTTANIGFSIYGYRGLKTQIEFQREAQQQSVPVDFRLVQNVGPSGDGLLTIRNAGNARLVNIEARIRFYFAFPDGEVATVRGIAKLLSNNSEKLELCKQANLVNIAADIHNLVEPSRHFDVSWIGAQGSSDGSDEFRPEVSPSSILNALRLASVLDARVVLHCSFSYQHAVSRQHFDKKFYILLIPTNAENAFDVRPAEAFDLSRIIGGQAVIDAIAEYDNSAKEVIFDGLPFGSTGSTPQQTKTEQDGAGQPATRSESK